MNRPIHITHNPTFQLCAGGVIALGMLIISLAVWVAFGWLAMKLVPQ